MTYRKLNTVSFEPFSVAADGLTYLFDVECTIVNKSLTVCVFGSKEAIRMSGDNIGTCELTRSSYLFNIVHTDPLYKDFKYFAEIDFNPIIFEKYFRPIYIPNEKSLPILLQELDEQILWNSWLA